MGQIKVEKNVGGIEGLCVIEPAVHGDARGYFMETYNEKDMKEAGIDIHFVQDRHTPPFFCSHQEPLYNQRNSHSLRFNFQEKIFQIFHLCKFRQKESQTFVNSHKCPAFLTDTFRNFHNLIVWNVSHNGMCNPPMFPT